MKLALLLASSTRKDEHGTTSALGMGITRLDMDTMPGRFHGALIIIASMEAGEELQQKFILHLRMPSGQQQLFATGDLKADRPQSTVIVAHNFEMLVDAEGIHSFRIESGGGASAEVTLSVGKLGATPRVAAKEAK